MTTPSLPKPTLVVKSEKPSLGELVGFYASLSDSAESTAIQQIPASDSHNLFLSARDAQGLLIGILRAWKEPPLTGEASAPSSYSGVIYEIAVREANRGHGVGKALRAKLKESTKGENIAWKGNPSRIAASLDRDLAIIRALYGISLIFGFQKVVEASYVQLIGDPTAAALPSTVKKALLPCLAIVLSALGTRFFWAVGNIRRFVLQRVAQLDPPSRRILVIAHLPLLFLHAVLFYVLCRIYQDICMFGLKPHYASSFVQAYGALLTLNVAWLLLLRHKRQDTGPERLWISNNILFAIAAFVWLALFKHSQISPEIQLFVACGLFFANSAIDLLKASHAYVMRDAFGGG